MYNCSRAVVGVGVRIGGRVGVVPIVDCTLQFILSKQSGDIKYSVPWNGA